MSFHGALIGIILGTYLFSKSKNIPTYFLLEIIACVSPIGIFFSPDEMSISNLFVSSSVAILAFSFLSDY